jgi:hypothetical protein
LFLQLGDRFQGQHFKKDERGERLELQQGPLSKSVDGNIRKFTGEIFLGGNNSKAPHFWRHTSLFIDGVGNVSTSRIVGQPDQLGVLNLTVVLDPLDASTGIDNWRKCSDHRVFPQKIGPPTKKYTVHTTKNTRS